MNNDISIDTLEKAGQRVNVVKYNGNDKAGLDVLLDYLSGEREMVGKLILKDGAILFRGFEINDRDDFLKVKEMYAGNSNFDYIDGNSPRTKLSNKIYTSTEYPREYRIPLHSEMSYSSKWPNVLFFYCKTPSAEGGETPIADCRIILKELGPEIVDKFEKYGVKYTRYLNGSNKIGKSWMDTFESKDKNVIEKYCDENRVEYSWDNNSLFLAQHGPGVAQHPVTQENVWFNQANQFHPSGLPQDICKGLQLLYSNNKRKYPQYAFYGNGEEIPEEHIKKITEIHFEYAIKFKWEKGDTLMLDNMLMAHGRMPFKGERKIYVSMC